MALSEITANDISNWDSLDDIVESFKKRGLKPRPSLGEEDEIVLELNDDEFMVLIEAGPTDSSQSFTSKMTASRHTHLVSTNDFEDFTFIHRVRSWDEHGRIKYQKFSFTKQQFTSESGEKYSVLDKLNDIEYGEPNTIESLYDTRKVVKRFYEEFKELRTKLVQEVSGIPDDRGDAKQQFVQVQLDRLIFLYFIQKKDLLDFNPNYLQEKHKNTVKEGEDVYEGFYKPLFFEILGEGKRSPEFGNLPT